MTPQAIRTAFEHLRSDEELQPLAAAAVSRSESDWLVGINSTRALTAFNSRHSGGFQKTTAGRVQTPTLAILVEREEKIRAFKSRTYWEVFGDFGVAAGAYRGRWFDETFKKGADEDARAERIWERARAEAIEQKCRGKTGAVTEEKKPQTQIPPLLYDLTTLQREANSRFGLPANRTLQIAQALYERHKVLTYPRTDSRFLPEDYLGTTQQRPAPASVIPRFRSTPPRRSRTAGSTPTSASSTTPRSPTTSQSSPPASRRVSWTRCRQKSTTWSPGASSPCFSRRRSSS